MPEEQIISHELFNSIIVKYCLQLAKKTTNQTKKRAERTHTREKEHKWKRNETVPLGEQLEQSEQAVKCLTRHLERQTCPKSLQYRARARIRENNEFRKDIKQLRSKAEGNYVEALIRFHYLRIDGLLSPLQKQKN